MSFKKEVDRDNCDSRSAHDPRGVRSVARACSTRDTGWRCHERTGCFTCHSDHDATASLKRSERVGGPYENSRTALPSESAVIISSMASSAGTVRM